MQHKRQKSAYLGAEYLPSEVSELNCSFIRGRLMVAQALHDRAYIHPTIKA